MPKKSRLIIITGLVAVIGLMLIVTSFVLQPKNEVALPTLMALPSLTPSEQGALAVVPSETATSAPTVATNTAVSPTALPPTATAVPTALPTIEATSTQTPSPSPMAVVPTAQPLLVPIPQQPIPNQVVIRFDPNATQQQRIAYIQSIGGTIEQNIDALDTIVVSVPAGTRPLPPAQAAIALATEPDYFVVAFQDPPSNDPLYPQQWALPVIGVPNAWSTFPANAPPVLVAVIDSGICADHPDLKGRIDAGWDFLENDAVPQDDFGHGCAVSGIIAANTNDGIGIAGIAPNTKIMPLRVLNAQGVGTYSSVAAAIIYAADHGVQIINLSLGGANPSTLLQDAIDYAISKGVIVIAAAGNTGGSVLYPAAYPPVIAVASVDQNLERSSFSSYGPEIDLLAPGRDILTTRRDGTYATMSGTSFAAPNVSGVAAIEMAFGRELTLGGIVAVGGASVVIAPTVTSTEIVHPTITPTISELPSQQPTSSTGRRSFPAMGIELNIPSNWIVNEYQNVGFGFSFYTPDISLEEPGFVLEGAYITLQVSEIGENSFTSPPDTAIPQTIGGLLGVKYQSINNFGTHEINVDVPRDNQLYHFVMQFSASDTKSSMYEATLDSILASLNFTDQVGQLPIREIPSLVNNSAFTSLSFPFEAGKEWKIISGYNNGGRHGGTNFGYALYAFDFVRNDGTTNNVLALAPTDGSLDHPHTGYDSQGQAYAHCIDVSISEVDSNNDLWLEVCHLDFESYQHAGSTITKGEVLGVLANDGCGGACTTRHIHMAAFIGKKGNPWLSPTTRQALAYTTTPYGNLSIQGTSFPSNGSSNQYANTTGIYSNIGPICAAGLDESIDSQDYCGGGGTACSGPSLNSPSDGFISTSQTITFSWSVLSGCTFNGYTLRVNDSSNMDDSPFYDQGVGELSRTVSIDSQWNNRDLWWGVRAANAPDGANWSVRRFRIEAGGGTQVQLCTTDDGQNCRSFSAGTYNLPDYGLNDQVRSVRVPSGMSLFVFNDDRLRNTTDCYGGDRIPLPIDSPWTIRGQVTSIVVMSTGNCPWSQVNTIVLFENTNFGGPRIAMGNQAAAQDIPAMNSYFNDKIEAVHIPSGISAILYENSDRSGQNTGCLNSDVSDLGSFKDKASFIDVFAQPNCPVAAAPSLNTPSNGTIFNRFDNITLTWNTSSGATQYYAEFWGGPSININSGWTSNLSWFVGSQWGGSYQWHVKSKNSNGESGWSEIRTLTIKYGSPSNLTASAVSDSQINLSWSASADAPGNIDGYRIYQNGFAIATVGSSTTTFNNIGLSCATPYNYYVKAYKGLDESDASNNSSATTGNCTPTTPQPPTLNNPANGSTIDRFTDITLSWNASTGATQYYAEFTGGPSVNINSGWTSNTSWFVGSQWGGTYQWRVKARNGAGESSWSDTRTLTVRVGTPAIVLGSMSSTQNQINLVWNASADAPGNIDGYYVYRDNTLAGTIGNSSTSFSDTGLNCNTWYDYDVTAFKGNNESYSAPVSFRTQDCPAGNGSGLTGEYYNNMDFTGFTLSRLDSTVNFDWGGGSPHTSIDAETFSVRWTGQVQPFYSQIYTFYTNTDDGVRLWVNGQLLIDKWLDQVEEWTGTISLQAGQRYDIKLEYYENGGGAVIKLDWSSASQTRQAIPQSQLYPYVVAPANLIANPLSQTQINLSWEDKSDNETSFRVERSPNGINSWGEIAQLAANTITYQNTNLACDTAYYYRVRALRTTGSQYSAFSNVASASTSICPPNPPILLAPNNNAALWNPAVTFSWQSPNSAGQTGYMFRISQSANPQSAPWLVNTILGNETLSYDYTFATDGIYYWHMQTTATSGNSQWVTRSLVIDNTLPTGTFTAPLENSYLTTNQTMIQIAANDSGSGVCRVDFINGYDPVLNEADVSNLNEHPTPTLLAQDSDLQAEGANVGAQSWDWQSIGSDSNGADGWNLLWDMTNIPDQPIAFFAYINDCAGNYQGIVNWTVTLDRAAPSSSVNALPVSSVASFGVSWTGTDVTSGIGTYDVQYQDNGGNWTNWQMNVTATEAIFTGVAGHTYGFRSRARDRAGNLEAWSVSADTQTTVVIPLSPPTLLIPAENAVLPSRTFSFSWQSPNSPNQTGYTLRLSQAANPDTAPWLINTTLGNTTLAYSYTVTDDGVFYWHMRTNTNNGTSGWVTRSFTIDTAPPTGSVISPPADSYLNTNFLTITGSASDSGSGIRYAQFFVGYNPTFSGQNLEASNIEYPPEPALSPDDMVTSGTTELEAQGWGWQEIGWDTDGSNGWSQNRDTQDIPDQNIAVWIYFYDFAGNYVGASNGNILLDRAAPSSTVDSLAASNSTSFDVSWSGTDATSGIAQYDIQYQDNGGNWTDWQTNVTATSAIFTGFTGHTYGFRSRARDFAGNEEAWQNIPDTSTTVTTSTPINDLFINAQALNSAPSTYTQDINGATISITDPSMCVYSRVNTVWFSYTPAIKQTINFNSEGSGYDTVIGVYTGSEGNLTQLACDDDGGTGVMSSVTLGLNAGITYHVMVAMYGSTPTTSTTMLTFSVQSTAVPTAPSLVLPANGIFSNETTPTFTWNTATNASMYQLQIDNVSTFTSPEQDTIVNGLSHLANTLSDGRYYWRVRAFNSLNMPGAWSATRSFTIDTIAPLPPVLKTPVNGFSTTNNRPGLAWAAVVGASRYEVQLGTTNPPFIIVTNTVSLNYVPPSPLLLTTYYWRVRAIDTAGNFSPWSETRSLIITSPANSAPSRNRFDTSTPTLTWGAVTWATGYEIQVDNNPNFASPEYVNNTIPMGTLLNTTTPLTNGTWYWRVRAQRSNGTWGPWSPVDSFIVDTP